MSFLFSSQEVRDLGRRHDVIKNESVVLIGQTNTVLVLREENRHAHATDFIYQSLQHSMTSPIFVLTTFCFLLFVRNIGKFFSLLYPLLMGISEANRVLQWLLS